MLTDVTELRRGGPSGPVRPCPAELGHGQQDDRIERLQRVHHLGIRDDHLYLLHVLRQKLDFPSLKRAVREQAALHRAEVVLIEDKASGTQLIQELTYEGMHAVKAYKPEASMDKLMRMYAQAGMIENGFVRLPARAEWLGPYLHELTTFPHAKHDDQTDSTAQALHWFKTGRKPVPGIPLHYEQLNAAANSSLSHSL